MIVIDPERDPVVPLTPFSRVSLALAAVERARTLISERRAPDDAELLLSTASDLLRHVRAELRDLAPVAS